MNSPLPSHCASPRAERGQGSGASARISQDDGRARAALLVRRDWPHYSRMLRFHDNRSERLIQKSF